MISNTSWAYICQYNATMFKFKTICERLGVPIVDDKIECPVTSMHYFGLTINNESMCVKIPDMYFLNNHCNNVEKYSNGEHDIEHLMGIHLSI
jgi:hypothetical protein